MRAGVIVTGVLSIGTAAVFGLAAVAATAFPQGTTVSATWNGGFGGGGMVVQPMPAPNGVPGPAQIMPVPPVIVIGNDGGASSGTTTVTPAATPVAPPDASSGPAAPSNTPPAK